MGKNRALKLKKMKKTSLLFIFLVISSCSSKNEIESINLKNYFWKIADYEQPKVIVYDYDSVGIVSRNYYLIEKIAGDKLQLTRYDSRFRETLLLIDKFRDNGVFLEKISHVEDVKQNIVTEVEIKKGLIFPFDSYRTKMILNSSFNPKSDNQIVISQKDIRELTELTKKEINGEMIPTLIAKGHSVIEIKNLKTAELDSIKIRMETWYSKDIGITRTREIYPFGEIGDRFVERISLEEFHKLKNK
mgnify:CR=1 FL=1